MAIRCDRSTLDQDSNVVELKVVVHRWSKNRLDMRSSRS